jgi:hypothetical protein
VQIEIQAVGEGVHEGAEPCGAGGVLGAELDGVDEELHAQIAVELLLALDFGEAAEGVDVVELDAVEVVLGLGVEEAEDGVGIGLSVDVGDAPRVANDGDVGACCCQRARSSAEAAWADGASMKTRKATTGANDFMGR